MRKRTFRTGFQHRITAYVVLMFASSANVTNAFAEPEEIPTKTTSRLSRGIPDGDATPRDTILAPLSIETLLQVDWVLYRQSSEDELNVDGEPLNEERIVLRRGRLRVSATRGPAVGTLELDANTNSGPTVRPYEATVGLHLFRSGNARQSTEPSLLETTPALLTLDTEGHRLDVSIQGGLLRIPFGYENGEREPLRPLLEKSLGTRAFFASGRDLGMVVAAYLPPLRFELGYMNGEPLDEWRYSGLDPTSAKDLVARTHVVVPLSRRFTFNVGFSGLSGVGFHSGDAAVKPTLLWLDSNENGLVELSELTATSGRPATASKTFKRDALGVDLSGQINWERVGKTEFVAEIVRSKNLDRGLFPADPVSQGRDLRELGWSVRVSQEIGNVGQLAFRYAYYDPDADSTRTKLDSVIPTNASLSLWSFSASVRTASTRFLLEYDHNNDHRGRNILGSPVRLRDDALTLRMELKMP